MRYIFIILFISMMTGVSAQTKLFVGYDRVIISNIQMHGAELGISGEKYMVNFSIAVRDELMNAGQVGVLRNVVDTYVFIGTGMSTYTLSEDVLHIMEKDDDDMKIKFGIPFNINYIGKHLGVTGSYTIMVDTNLPNMFKIGLVIGLNFK